MEHLSQKISEIAPNEHAESAAEYLRCVQAALASLPEPLQENQRLEINEPKVVLALGRTRYFHGFLRSRVVFGFDPALAPALSSEVASKIQAALALLGLETQQLPSPSKTEASF